jgi:hypothetical protein
VNSTPPKYQHASIVTLSLSRKRAWHICQAGSFALPRVARCLLPSTPPLLFAPLRAKRGASRKGGHPKAVIDSWRKSPRNICIYITSGSQQQASKWMPQVQCSTTSGKCSTRKSDPTLGLPLHPRYVCISRQVRVRWGGGIWRSRSETLSMLSSISKYHVR